VTNIASLNVDFSDFQNRDPFFIEEKVIGRYPIIHPNNT
jgi:hypothetical protein